MNSSSVNLNDYRNNYVFFHNFTWHYMGEF